MDSCKVLDGVHAGQTNTTEAWAASTRKRMTRELLAHEDATTSRWLARGRRVSEEVAMELSSQGEKIVCIPELHGGGCGFSKVSCEVRLGITSCICTEETSC
jgi:hypothetical protein